MSLSTAPASVRKTYYQRIVSLPPMLSLLAMAALLCPSARILCGGFQQLYEGWTLYMFGLLLFLLLARESSVYVSKQGAISQGIVQDILTAVAAHGHRKIYGVMPLGCCFRPCMRARDLSRQ